MPSWKRFTKRAASRSLRDAMIHPVPLVLEGRGLRLEPLTLAHRADLAAAAADGGLWDLGFTSVPSPGQEEGYIRTALDGQRDGHMLPWAVRDLDTGTRRAMAGHHQQRRTGASVLADHAVVQGFS